MKTARFSLHAFGKELLLRKNNYVRAFAIGRLAILWDTKKSADRPRVTINLTPRSTDE